LIFAFTIGGYWFLAPLKDSIFMKNMCLDFHLGAVFTYSLLFIIN
jgi:hypothetical protein